MLFASLKHALHVSSNPHVTKTSWWLSHPFEKYAHQIGNLPQIEVNRKKYLKPPPRKTCHLFSSIQSQARVKTSDSPWPVVRVMCVSSREGFCLDRFFPGFPNEFVGRNRNQRVSWLMSWAQPFPSKHLIMSCWVYLVPKKSL